MHQEIDVLEEDIQATKDANANPFRLTFDQLVLTLGYRCNMVCKSCFIGEKLFDHETQLTYEDAIRVIESAARLQTIGTIAFVGGEPFIFYKLMLKIGAYIHAHYGCPLNVTTNGSWAKSPEAARKLLSPLRNVGLGWLMLSLDQYHLEHASLDQAMHCLNGSLDYGINTAVQVIRRVGAPTAKDFKEMLTDRVDVDRIEWIENPCSAIGNAASMLGREQLEWYDDIPPGGCNAGEILNIQPDGEIKPCCGSGLMAKRLSLGNAKTEDVDRQVRAAETDGILNSLIAEQGPRGLARLLREAGRADLVERHAPFTDACYACHAFMTDPEVLELLETLVERRTVPLLASRVLSQHGPEIMSAIANADQPHAPRR